MIDEHEEDDECMQNDRNWSSGVVWQKQNISGTGEGGIVLTCEVKGPKGEQIHDFRDKTSDKYDFVAHKDGLYQFCFSNKSPYHETIDFDVHSSHFYADVEHAKDGESIQAFFFHVRKGNLLWPDFLLLKL